MNATEMMSASDNNEILSVEYYSEVFSNNLDTYSQLSEEIGAGGNVTLQQDYYTYDSGENSIIDDNGSVIGMYGSNIHAFNVIGAKSNDGSDVVGSASNDNLLSSSGPFHYGSNTYEHLDDAIDAAVDGGGGTIYIEEGIYTALDDDLWFRISDPVTLTFSRYNPQGYVVFLSDTEHYIFYITDENAYITFNDIKFCHGKAHWGGAIETYGQLTLNNCIFEENGAAESWGDGGYGGAIYVDDGGSLIANNCQFLNNKVFRISASGGGAWGGAIAKHKDAPVTLKNCYFRGNVQQIERGPIEENDIGGIDDEYDKNWYFENCNFKGHDSINIEVFDNSVEVTHSGFHERINYVVLYKNGEEYDRKSCSDQGTVTFNNLESGDYTVLTAYNREKIYGYDDSTFTIKPSIKPFILDNTMSFKTLNDAVNAIPDGGSGVISVLGGTYMESSSNVQIRNKTVTIKPKVSSESVTFSSTSQNYLFDVGQGARITMENMTITGMFSSSALIFNTSLMCSLSDCKFKNIVNSRNLSGNPIDAQDSNLALNGCTFESNGDILFKNTTVEINECTFTSNSGNMGVIYADASSELSVVCSRFNSNTASYYGGAIYFEYKCTVTNCNFTNNSAFDGGAIRFKGEGTLTNCMFVNNAAHDGGAIYFEGNGTVLNCNFVDNKATYYEGGAIYLVGPGTVSSCNFTGNTAVLNGGAIQVRKGSVENCNFVNNAARYGGAIYLNDGCVENCNFVNNSATKRGGAIEGRSAVINTNCNFINNTANDYGGAGYFWDMDECSVENCNFINNKATGDNSGGGAVYFDRFGTATNCAFVNNTANKGSAVCLKSGGSLDNNWWGSNNPDFVNLINEGIVPSSYVVLNVSADSQSIDQEFKVKLNYTFLRNGTSDVLSLPSRYISLSTTGGQLDDTSGYMINGKFSTEFSSDTGGDYEITAIVDNQDVKINVMVKSNFDPDVNITRFIVGFNDLTGDYLENPPYVVQVIGDDGNPVGEGETVRVVFDGFYYDLKTNATGHVVRTIGLAPGMYTVKTYYKGYNTIATVFVVNQILKVTSGTLKKTAKSYTLKATLKSSNGKALANKKVKLTFKGKTYKVFTNSKGVASKRITVSVIKTLKSGKTYILQARYVNDIAKGKIKVVK